MLAVVFSRADVAWRTYSSDELARVAEAAADDVVGGSKGRGILYLSRAFLEGTRRKSDIYCHHTA
jgi:hypothetical protein